MVSTSTCDRCGASPAHPVEASASITGIVLEGAATSHSESVDACAECESIILTALHDLDVEMIREQAPFHIEILALTAQRDAAQIELDSMPDADEDRAAAIALVADLEEQRAAKVVAATAASDARKAAFLESLSIA